MCWIEVRDYQSTKFAESASNRCAEHLESGQILFFPESPLFLSPEDRQFLLGQHQSSSQFHKNISYRPGRDAVRGFASRDRDVLARLKRVLRDFSYRATEFAGRLLPAYAAQWSLDFASFRPFQESGRNLPLKKRNDLLHVDAFPTRPTHGARILRFFVNLNPQESRVWLTTRPFAALAEHFAESSGLGQIAAASTNPAHRLQRILARAGRRLGLPVAARSPYDQFMLRFHDHLKESSVLQTQWPKIRLEFPPGSAWMTFTDSVPHAALSGQYAMEQTYLVPLAAMHRPELAPLSVLEQQCGHSLVDRKHAPPQQPLGERTLPIAGQSAMAPPLQKKAA